jgi:hypothetical protein
MIIVFEGCRNSGKSFLSSKVSEQMGIPRYKFNFAEYFGDLGLESSASLPAHSFAMGKELMLLQLNRDGFLSGDFILDRGFLTVLAWGLCENRINEDQMRSQAKMFRERGLCKDIVVIYVDGKNPNTSSRNKDIWDSKENDTSEKEAFNLVLGEIESSASGIKVIRFENDFTQDSILKMINTIKDVRNNSN